MGYEVRLINQLMGKVRHPGPIPHRLGKQVSKLPRIRPAPFALVKYQRHDWTKFPRRWPLLHIDIPDAAAIFQQTKPHPAIRARLVFQEDVEPKRCATSKVLHLVEKVCFTAV